MSNGNETSKRAFEKAGFNVAGVLREYFNRARACVTVLGCSEDVPSLWVGRLTIPRGTK